jgi:hypothetical protein
MASLRNLAVSALQLAGHPNLVAALRHTGRDPPGRLPSSAWHTDEPTSQHYDGALGHIRPTPMLDLPTLDQSFVT